MNLISRIHVFCELLASLLQGPMFVWLLRRDWLGIFGTPNRVARSFRNISLFSFISQTPKSRINSSLGDQWGSLNSAHAMKFPADVRNFGIGPTKLNRLTNDVVAPKEKIAEKRSVDLRENTHRPREERHPRTGKTRRERLGQ